MKWRIMIVDDEEDVRAILKATLSDKFEVVEAHDGLDALEKLERYEPDFIILDVMMPMMDGFEACASIRNHPKFKETPVLFLTALGGKEHIKRGYSTGANLYLTKPFEPQRLLKNLEVHFDASKAAARRKRYTIEEIRNLEESGTEPVAPGSGVYDVREVMKEPDKPVGVEAPRPRVMVVDDDPDIVSIVDASLGDKMEVCSAGDGFQAIERLVRFQPDVLILDIMLPKLSGFQLCQSLRSNRAFKTLPVLVCSAKCSDRDQKFAQRVGANDFLAKPFTPDSLLERVENLTKLEGFRIRPKQLSIEEIRKQEEPEKSDVFNEEEERIRKMKLDQSELKNFLQEQKKGESTGDEDKKGRSIFKFGRK